MLVGKFHWRRMEKKFDSKMMKSNILTQGNSLELTLRLELDDIRAAAEKVNHCHRFIFSGAGDKYIVPLIGKFLWDHLSKRPLDVYHSRVLADYKFKLDQDTCVVFLTQSGTTKDTLDACKVAIENGCKIIAITNLHDEPEKENIITLLKNYENGRILKTHTLLHPEHPLPSTNTFHTSLMVLNLLTLHLNPNDEIMRLQKEKIPELVRKLSTSREVIEWGRKTAAKLYGKNFLYVMGDGPRFHVAEKHSKVMLMEGVKIDACPIESEDFVHSLIETLEFQKRHLILLQPLSVWNEKNYNLIRTLWSDYSGKDRLIMTNPFNFLNGDDIEEFSGIEGNLLSPFFYIIPLEWQSFYSAILRKVDPGVGKLVNKIRDDDQFKKLIK